MERDFLSLACLAGGVAHGWERGNGGPSSFGHIFSANQTKPNNTFSRGQEIC